MTLGWRPLCETPQTPTTVENDGLTVQFQYLLEDNWTMYSPAAVRLAPDTFFDQGPLSAPFAETTP